jgi:hypothetical protein
MATKAMARTEIAEKLLRAKEEATTHLLRVTTLPPRFTAFTASSHPNHNVVGIGIGYKITHGKLTAQRCIRIYVDRKIAKTAMPKDCVLPPHIKGVPTDVVETGRFHPLPAVIPKERRRLTASENMRVEKVGRTTGYTTGIVFDVSADIKIEYDLGMLTFQDQILVRGNAGPFSDHGDSGSVIVDRATKRATALLFAGSASHTIANPLEEVLAQLAVRMVV